MRDFNFFSVYVNEKNKNKNEKIYMVLIISIALLFIVGTFSYNKVYKFMVNKDIEAVKSEIEDSDNQVLLKKAETLNKKGQILSSYSQGINIIWSIVESRSTVNGELISNISKSIPKEVSFKSITIGEGTINIQGVSKNRTSIAELEHNIKLIENIGQVNVSNINLDNKGTNLEYSFSLKCTLKGEVKK